MVLDKMIMNELLEMRLSMSSEGNKSMRTLE